MFEKRGAMAKTARSDRLQIAEVLFKAYAEDLAFKQDLSIICMSLQDKEVRRCLMNPLLNRHQYKELWQQLCQGLALKSAIAQVVEWLCDLGRGKVIVQILECISERVQLQLGHIIAKVEVARPLNAHMEQTILKFVAQKMLGSEAKDVTLQQVINPAIVDGVRIAAGNKWIDLSTRTALKNLEQKIRG